MELTLKLTLDEVNSLLTILGQMQNSTHTYALLMKVKEQGTDQVKLQSAPAEIVP